MWCFGPAPSCKLKANHVASGNVSNGITEELLAGGTQSGGVVLSGGVVACLSGGVASGVTISRGGRLCRSRPAVSTAEPRSAAAGPRWFPAAGPSAAPRSTAAACCRCFPAAPRCRPCLKAATPRRPAERRSSAAGGIATATRLTGRGLLIVSSGGTAQSTVVDSRNGSGGVIVFGHGLAIGTVIDSGSTEFLSGGTDHNGIVSSGGRIVVGSGGTAIDVTISGGGTATISSGGLITADAGGTANIDGVAINSGVLLASTASSFIDIAGVVSGGAVSIGDGLVEVEAGGTANVIFLSTGIGGLEIADTANNPTAFTGAVSGFGGVGHSNHAQFIDLLFVTSDATVSVNFVSAASHTSGALMVSSGGQLVASIDLIGVYSTGDLRVVSGVSATVKILDPVVVGGGSVDISSAAMVWLRNSIDPPGVAAGARATLAGTTDARETGSSPPAAARAAAVALLGNYMAASFVDAAHAQGGARVTDSQPSEQPQLTHPHH